MNWSQGSNQMALLVYQRRKCGPCLQKPAQLPPHPKATFFSSISCLTWWQVTQSVPGVGRPWVLACRKSNGNGYNWSHTMSRLLFMPRSWGHRTASWGGLSKGLWETLLFTVNKERAEGENMTQKFLCFSQVCFGESLHLKPFSFFFVCLFVFFNISQIEMQTSWKLWTQKNAQRVLAESEPQLQWHPGPPPWPLGAHIGPRVRRFAFNNAHIGKHQSDKESSGDSISMCFLFPHLSSAYTLPFFKLPQIFSCSPGNPAEPFYTLHWNQLTAVLLWESKWKMAALS